ncbi:uracil phosphoribosyltransferase homolog [Dysidea avara]|uniref:uracil phosphoribosyltransferase homolog n=1 Tax=Dysidea avara TaxID=196820 RepID=UPI00332831E5
MGTNSPLESSSSASMASSVDLDVIELIESFPNLKVMESNNQIKELQTVLRDKTTCREDFVFYSDRLIRLVIEEALNWLPCEKITVTTPTGFEYEGQMFVKGNCGVSIMRSGEAMERGLRECCRSIRIGKILIRHDPDTKEPKLYYAKFPADIDKLNILLLSPNLETGGTVSKAINTLKEHGVRVEKIILVTLFATPQGIKGLLTTFPDLKLLTSEVYSHCVNHFGKIYFGTD